MPTTFGFSANTLETPTYLTLGALTPGSAPGVNDPSQDSAIANAQAIESAGDVDVFAVTLLAGQSYSFDIDDGAGDSSGGSVDIELDLIDAQGNLVLSDDGSSSTDSGSSSTLDPNITVKVNQSGTYYIAVHAQDAEYNSGTFGFSSNGSVDVGDYDLVVSSDLPSKLTLGSGSDTRTLTNGNDNVSAGAGGDTIFAVNGRDIVDGGSGSDTLYGGGGSDELAGGNGDDDLYGNDGDDVLVGGDKSDYLSGGANEDALHGGVDSDYLQGGSGRDTMWGEGGADQLYGGGDDDFIRGGRGVDDMSGGGGADRFHFLPGEAKFNAASLREDTIRDFQTQDTLDLSDVWNGTLSFRGSSGFTGAGQVRVVDYRAADGSGLQEVRVNLDNDTGDVELAFLVDTSGNFTLRSDDFIL